MFSSLVADIRYSLRSLARRPAFAVVVVLTLSGGIAINVAIYSIFEQVPVVFTSQALHGPIEPAVHT